MPKDKVEFAGSVSAQEAAQYLESLATGLRERAILLESGDSSVTFEVAEDVKIEIEATTNAEKGKSSIDVRMSWRQLRPEEADLAPPGLLIIAGATPTEVPTAFAE